ncbi:MULTISPECIES: hypothetical protein [Stenotrophomonas]|uniref:hypothetical protein n=1 Tax=Stenotrophomonas TaxID=40323 RepID=UPI0012E36EBC|nr:MULTISPECIES: hypothetical protein [Stenotrophomonas]
MSDSYNIDRRPPCWPTGEQCPNACASAHHRRIIENHVELHVPWAGWRLAGRNLAANESRNVECVTCPGAPMPLTYVTQYKKGTLRE